MAKATPLAACGECGALNEIDAAECWLCRRRHGRPAEIITAELVGSRRSSHTAERLSQAALAVVAISLVLLTIGIGLDEPRQLIPFLIVVGPAVLATVLRDPAWRGGESASWTGRLATFVVSLMATFAVIALLIVAAIAAFFVYCWIVILS